MNPIMKGASLCIGCGLTSDRKPSISPRRDGKYRCNDCAGAEENADTFFRLSGWVSVKDRLPEPNTKFIAAYFDSLSGYSLAITSQFFPGRMTHWMPLPNPPAPPKSDAEIAWERWQDTSDCREYSLKAAFIAGFNAEVAK